MTTHPFTPGQTEVIGKYAQSLISGDVDGRARSEAETKAREKYDTAVSGVIGLSPEHRRFTVEMLVGTNYEQAYKIAFPRYQGKQARKLGWALRRKPFIQNAIDEILTYEAMPAKEVIARLSDQARAGYGEYINIDGSIDLERLKSDGKMHLVKSVRPSQYGLVVEFYDAHQALVDMGRVWGLFTDRLKMEDWQDEVVALLRTGQMTPAEARAAWPDLAAQFFAKAGIHADRD